MFDRPDIRNRLAEVQGPYGPLQVLEGKVQQVWTLQQIQQGNWLTRSGARLRVKFPGHWNRGAGPDFKEATVELDGETRIGDIEIHLYREDWWRHGHHLDPAYDSVILHVVLFAGGMDRDIRTCRESEPEEWIMGPWMREDLESVVGGEPGLFGEVAPEFREWIESDDPGGIRERLRIGADRRCQDKESMARCLWSEFGWSEGLHRLMLYYLGYPFNRRAFFEMAEAFPLAAWQAGGLFDILKERWARSARWTLGRPANRAGRRLREYFQLNKEVADWPARLVSPPFRLMEHVNPSFKGDDPGTPTVRRAWRISRWRSWIGDEVLGGIFGDGMIDRLWIDVLLPFMMANGCLDSQCGAVLWFHAHAGAFPDSFRDILKLADIQQSRAIPLCNGWVQGLIWIDDQLRLERIRTSLGSQALSKPGLTS